MKYPTNDLLNSEVLKSAGNTSFEANSIDLNGITYYIPSGVSRDSFTGLPDSGHRREFDSGAVRDMAEGKGRCDLLPACAIIRLSKHYEAGAIKYEPRNWEKGLPMSSFIDSALRHILKYLDGQTDEDHLTAAAWNVLGAMWTEEKRPDLQDIPTRGENIHSNRRDE